MIILGASAAGCLGLYKTGLGGWALLDHCSDSCKRRCRGNLFLQQLLPLLLLLYVDWDSCWIGVQHTIDARVLCT